MFPTILLFHPNNEDRQDLNIEQEKLNKNNRNGKQEHWKVLNLIITSNTNMMTSINGKNYQICYRCGVINDFIIRAPKPLGPFNHFGYFRLVYVYSIFRFCRSSLIRGKRRKVGYINSFCMLYWLKFISDIFLQPLSNAQIIKHRHLFTNWPKHIPFVAVAFIPLLNGKLDIKF